MQRGTVGGVVVVLALGTATGSGLAATPAALAEVPGATSCGAHALKLGAEVVFDGKPIAREANSVEVLGRPTWRSDCSGVAWMERSAGVTNLVVLTASGGAVDARTWSLPLVAATDRIFWTGAKAVTVGEHALKPRMIARWA